jgi:hypothetical protein
MKRNQSAKREDKVNVMLLVTDHNLLSKGLTSHFTPNTFIADSGAICHMRVSIVRIFNLKPHVTDIMVGNNETMSSFSKGNYIVLVLQKDGSSFEVILQDVLYIPTLMVNLSSLNKAISKKVVQLSNKGQIITLHIAKNEISTWFWSAFGY